MKMKKNKKEKVEKAIEKKEVKSEVNNVETNIEENEVKNEVNTNTKDSSNTIIYILLVIIVCLLFVIGYLLGAKQKDKLIIDENPNNTSVIDEKEDPTSEDDEDYDDEDYDDEDYDDEDYDEEDINDDENETDDSLDDLLEPFEDWKEKEFNELKNHAKEATINSRIDYTKDKYGITYHLCGSAAFPFEEKDVSIADLTDDYKLDMLIGLLPKADFRLSDQEFGMNYDLDVVSVFDEDFAKQFFDDTHFLQRIEDYEYQGTYPYGLVYRDNKYYLLEYAGGCTIANDYGLHIEYNNSRKEGNYIIKTFKAYYLETDTEDDTDNYTYNYYKDERMNEKILSYKDNDKNTPNIKNYYNKLNSYDVYFDISNGKFKFVKAVFIKK